MARGYFRTPKNVCVCCGANGDRNKIFRRGAKNIPSYQCEKCFDKYANETEKANKKDLLVYDNGVEVKKSRKKKGASI